MTAQSRVPDGLAPFSDEPNRPTAQVLVEVASITAAAAGRDSAVVLPVHPAPRYGQAPMWAGLWRLTAEPRLPLLPPHSSPSRAVRVVLGIEHANPSLPELLDELSLRELTYVAFTRDPLGATPPPAGCITKLTVAELWHQASLRRNEGRYRSFLFGHAEPQLQHEHLTLHGR